MNHQDPCDYVVGQATHCCNTDFQTNLLSRRLLLFLNRLFSSLDVKEDNIVRPLAVSLQIIRAHPKPTVHADVQSCWTLLGGEKLRLCFELECLTGESKL